MIRLFWTHVFLNSDHVRNVFNHWPRGLCLTERQHTISVDNWKRHRADRQAKRVSAAIGLEGGIRREYGKQRDKSLPHCRIFQVRQIARFGAIDSLNQRKKFEILSLICC